jgi:hypothetical protein
LLFNVQISPINVGCSLPKGFIAVTSAELSSSSMGKKPVEIIAWSLPNVYSILGDEVKEGMAVDMSAAILDTGKNG